MNATTPPDNFYASLPIFRDFTQVMDPTLFKPCLLYTSDAADE